MPRRKIKNMSRRQQQAACVNMGRNKSSCKSTTMSRSRKMTTSSDQPFQHNGYTLHTREVTLGQGHIQRIYFFSKHKPKSGIPTGRPDGYSVGVNDRTGLPYLKKSK